MVSKNLKCFKTKPQLKKSVSKTCVIMTSLKRFTNEEMDEVRINKCCRAYREYKEDSG
jgi:hypothetical protein